MCKRITLSTIAVFLVWSVLDYLIHVVLLSKTYADTAQFWRPEEEMKMGLMYVVTLICAAAFSTIYARLIAPKSVGRGVEFGLYYGIAVGVGMGYGTYSVMPLPYNLALTWFLGTVVQATAAGLVVGLIVREMSASQPPASAEQETQV